MSIPAATYRLQFGRGFGFRQAANAVPYLASLGVSHVYASPLLAGVTGGHGYDTVDPSRLSPELGTAADFQTFWDALREHALGLMLDVVPNHMAADPDQNPWWRDVLVRGRGSRFAGWFDVDWDAPGLDGRILVPALGAPLEDVLAAGELTVERRGTDAEPVVRYHERTFPIARGTATRADLATAGRDPDALAALLDRQPYRLADWRLGNTRLNWRRFFDISSLVAVRQEVGAVFDATHRLVLRLIERGRADGVPVALRVDHVDGLADPDGYLARLRDATGPETHIVVEKILARGEDLRPRGRWPERAGTRSWTPRTACSSTRRASPASGRLRCGPAGSPSLRSTTSPGTASASCSPSCSAPNATGWGGSPTGRHPRLRRRSPPRTSRSATWGTRSSS